MLKFLTLFCFMTGLVSLGGEVFAKEIGLIKSQYTFRGKGWMQFGQGWVIQFTGEADKFYLATPNHVIDKANKIYFQCNNNDEILLSVISQSATYDLALLEFTQIPISCDLKPLLTINHLYGSRYSYHGLSGLKEPMGGYRYATKKGERSVVGERLEDEIRITNSFLYPYSKALLVPIGIQPGMSGSPLFQTTKEPPLGMVLQSKINDRWALLAPLQEMVGLLSEMKFRKGDPWVLKYSQNEIQYELAVTSNRVSRTKVLIHRENDKQFTFRENCPQSRFGLASQWAEQGDGGSFGESGGSFGESGGSFGESSEPGNIGKSTKLSSKKAPFLREFTGTDQYISNQSKGDKTKVSSVVNSTYYKDTNSCAAEGIRLDDQRVLLALYDPDHLVYLKFENLNQLLKIAVEQKSNFRNYLNKYGVFKESAISFLNFYCRPQILGNSMKLNLEHSQMALAQKFHVHFNNQVQLVPEQVVWLAASPYESSKPTSFIQCEESDGQNSLVIQNSTLEFSFKVRFVRGGLSGTMGFRLIDQVLKHFENGRIEGLYPESLVVEDDFLIEKFEINDGKDWDHTLTTPNGIKVRFSLNTTGRIFEMTLLEFPKSINDLVNPSFVLNSLGGPFPLWMIKSYLVGELK